MKDIIWKNLIQNIVRCIVAYPLFFIAFVISIPINIIGWFAFIVEIVFDFLNFILTGNFGLFENTIIGNLITDFSFCDLIFVIFPLTFLITENTIDFNKTLKPIKRS